MRASLLAAWTDRDAGELAAAELDAAGDRYPDLARVRAYWDGKCRGRFAPRRADIDPVDLKDVLPRVMLADAIAGPSGEAVDFRYRLAGTGIDALHGQDPTGKSPRALMPPAYGALIHAHYCEAVRRRAPLLHVIALDSRERARSYARLLLPLSEDGARVTMLMTVDSKEQNTDALRQFFAAARRGA